MGRDQALMLAKQVDEIIASKGTKVVRLNLRKDRPDEETLLGVMLGPTGNLRAPTIRHGRTLLIGFDESAYAQVLKGSTAGKPS